MQSIYPNVNPRSALATGNGNDATPFSPQSVVLTKQASIERKWEAHYWRAQHARLLEREAALKAEVETLQAPIRDLHQRLSGAKSEQASGADAAGQSTPGNPRNRGQQPGRQGHGRSDRAALPVVAEGHDLREAAQPCPTCGEVFAPFPRAAESTLIDIQVQAHMRRIQRPRYQKTCPCPQVPGIVTAPPAPRGIPKSSLGGAVWTRVVLDTYLYSRPTHR